MILIWKATLVYSQGEHIDSLSAISKVSQNDTSKIDLLNVYKNKAAAFAARELFDSAYLYQVRYVEVRDSLFNQRNARLQTFYETELLQKENEATLTTLRQRNAVIIIVGTLFILSMVVAAALYRQRRAQQHINKLLVTKNNQIRKQSEEIHLQAGKVRKLNTDLASLNKNLERQIKSRTKMLKDQNKLLAEYAHSNAHELRAPVASVMGLVDLLKRSTVAREEEEIVGHLSKSASQLDLVVRDIRIKLERSEALFFDDPDITEKNNKASGLHQP